MVVVKETSCAKVFLPRAINTCRPSRPGAVQVQRGIQVKKPSHEGSVSGGSKVRSFISEGYPLLPGMVISHERW